MDGIVEKIKDEHPRNVGIGIELPPKVVWKTVINSKKTNGGDSLVIVVTGNTEVSRVKTPIVTAKNYIEIHIGIADILVNKVNANVLCNYKMVEND